MPPRSIGAEKITVAESKGGVANLANANLLLYDVSGMTVISCQKQLIWNLTNGIKKIRPSIMKFVRFALQEGERKDQDAAIKTYLTEGVRPGYIDFPFPPQLLILEYSLLA